MTETHSCIACEMTKDKPFGLHKAQPPSRLSGYRTCPGGKSVPTKEVEQEIKRRNDAFITNMLKIAKQESGL